RGYRPPQAADRSGTILCPSRPAAHLAQLDRARVDRPAYRHWQGEDAAEEEDAVAHSKVPDAAASHPLTPEARRREWLMDQSWSAPFPPPRLWKPWGKEV